MAITPINNTTQPQKRFPIVKITGYAAAATGIASGIVAKNKKIKLHTNLAYITGILTAAHIALVEYFHSKKNKN